MTQKRFLKSHFESYDLVASAVVRAGLDWERKRFDKELDSLSLLGNCGVISRRCEALVTILLFFILMGIGMKKTEATRT